MVDSFPEVRRIVTRDAPALRDLRFRALRNDPQAFLSTLARELERPEQHWVELTRRTATGEQEAIMVCEQGGDLVGMAGLHAESPQRVNLWGVYLDQHCRGKGFSQRLLGELIEWARQAGYQEIALEVNPELKPAVALYRSLGFLPVGQSDNCCGGTRAQAWRLDFG